VTAGIGMGFSLVPGVSSNITSMDISYGSGGMGSSIMGFSSDGNGGMRFSPSISYGYGFNISRKQVPQYADASISACDNCPTVVLDDFYVSSNNQVLIGYDTKVVVEGGPGGGWLDNFQTALDIAGIADPTGIADIANAAIYLGRGHWKDAAISALSIIPLADLAKAGRLGTKTLQLTSKARTAEKGLEIGERFLGAGYKEIAPGVFRSSDGLRQFRMTDADILGKHGNVGPHFNFEILDASGNFLKNYHMPIK
jgi:hypothetical protein